jgi:hypothetical protein
VSILWPWRGGRRSRTIGRGERAASPRRGSGTRITPAGRPVRPGNLRPFDPLRRRGPGAQQRVGLAGIPAQGLQELQREPRKHRGHAALELVFGLRGQVVEDEREVRLPRDQFRGHAVEVEQLAEARRGRELLGAVVQHERQDRWQPAAARVVLVVPRPDRLQVAEHLQGP